MKTIAWLAGIGTLVAAGAYMIVSLNRWEWNRALFFGLIVLVAEVALATGLVLRRLAHIEQRGKVDRDVQDILRDNRLPSRDRFAWLKDSTHGLNVFITFLVGGGVILSGVAWVVDRLASKTTTPVGEQRLARELGPISYRRGGLLVDDVTVLAQDVPGADDAQIRKLLRRAGHGVKRPSLGALALGAVGLAVGTVGVLAMREATLSTHDEAIDPDSQVEVVLEASSKGAEPGQSLAETVEAQLLACRLEITSDVVGEIEVEDDRTFTAVLAPDMDQTNRRQFKGCMEDWVLDHVRIDVLSIEAAAPSG